MLNQNASPDIDTENVLYTLNRAGWLNKFLFYMLEQSIKSIGVNIEERPLCIRGKCPFSTSKHDRSGAF